MTLISGTTVGDGADVQVVQDSTPTLVSYPPTLLPGYDGQPTIRLRTPNQQLPDTGVAAFIDPIAGVVDSAALRGARVLTSFTQDDGDPISSGLVESSSAASVVIDEYAPLADGVYTFVITYNLGDAGGTKDGHWDGTVTVTNGVCVLSSFSETVTGTTGSGGITLGTSLSSGQDTFTINGSSAFVAGGEFAASAVFTLIPAFVKGRAYLVVDATTGDAFTVVCNESASETIRLRDPLPRDVASGSTVTGLACFYAMTADQTASVGRGVAEWSIGVDGGEVLTWRQDLRIVTALPSPPINAAELAHLSSYAKRMQPPDDADFSATLSTAWRLHLLPAMLQAGISPERIISWEAIASWVIAAIEYTLSREDQDPAVRDEKKKEMTSAQLEAIRSKRFWVDEGDDLGAPNEDPDRPRGFDTTFATR